MDVLTGFGIVGAYGLFLLLVLLVVLWVAMPFAIFGTKDLLRQLLVEQKKTNRLLEELADQKETRL